MKNRVFLIFLALFLVNAGCLSADKNTQAFSTQTMAMTQLSTIQTTELPTPIPLVTVEPIVGVWGGTDDVNGISGYFRFFDDGNVKFTLSIGNVPNIEGNQSWIKRQEDSKTVYYTVTYPAVNTSSKITYSRLDDSFTVDSSNGVKYFRIPGHSFD